MPLRCDIWVDCRQRITVVDLFAGAKWATAIQGGSTINFCLPNVRMVFVALPPGTCVCMGGYILGVECGVPARVQLPCYVRKERKQALGSNLTQRTLTRNTVTRVVAQTSNYRLLPLMLRIFRTLPPNSLW